MPVAPELEGLQNRLKSMASKYAACVTQITEAKDQELLDFCARRLVEMAAHIIMGHLMVQDASKSDLFSESAQVYVRYAEAEVEKHINFIRKFDKDDLAYYRSKEFTSRLKKGIRTTESLFFFYYRREASYFYLPKIPN